jgi:hypothetical protein
VAGRDPEQRRGARRAIATNGMVLDRDLNAAVTFADAVTPALLIALTAALEAGSALQTATFSAIQPELVPREEIPTPRS